MEQLPLFTQRFWTVTEFTAYIRRLLEKEPATQDCWVKGEISNLSRPGSGHIYFTLKDSNAALKCVVWRTDASRIRIAWMDGLEVDVHGRITVYEVSGQYQLIVDAVQPVGEGYLFQEFLKLKARLEAEGLFDPDRKRPIPECSEKDRDRYLCNRGGCSGYAQYYSQEISDCGSDSLPHSGSGS